MAKNYVKPCDVIYYTNSTAAAISSGDPVVIGNQQMGIALVDIAISATGSVAKEGVFSLAKNTAQAVVQGQKLWWDATAKKVINAPAINAYFIGYADQAELAATATVHVDLEEFSEEGPRTLTLAATGAQTLNVGDFGGGDLTVFAPNTAAQTVNLPSVATIAPGSKLFVKKTDATAQAITLDPAGSETIAGGATFATQDANNDLAQFVSTGAAWVLTYSVIA
jgi:predicted RecA/RadA family phage recombinase